jgi:hypothetical protein
MVIALIAFLHVRLLSNQVIYHSTGHHWLGFSLATWIALVTVAMLVIVIMAIIMILGRRNNS